MLYAYGLGIPLITNPFGESIATGVFDLPLTILWVLIVVNAINLIDGIDGLASGAVFIAAVTLWFVGRTNGDFYVMFVASIIVGATFGFLRYNFPPAKVFMGDTGSGFLGLLLAAVALLGEPKRDRGHHAALPIGCSGSADLGQCHRIRATRRRRAIGVPRRQ